MNKLETKLSLSKIKHNGKVKIYSEYVGEIIIECAGKNYTTSEGEVRLICQDGGGYYKFKKKTEISYVLARISEYENAQEVNK